MRNSNSMSSPTVLVLLLPEGLSVREAPSDVVALGSGVWVWVKDVSVCADLCNSFLPAWSTALCSCWKLPWPPLSRQKAVPPVSSSQRRIWCAQLVQRPLGEPGNSSSFPCTRLGCKSLCKNRRISAHPQPRSLRITDQLQCTQAAVWGLQSLRLSGKAGNGSVCSAMPQAYLSLVALCKDSALEGAPSSRRPHN